jgi:hypothetical protein
MWFPSFIKLLFQILSSQLGIVDFSPFKSLFLSEFSRSHFLLAGLPNIPSMSYAIHRNFQEAGAKRLFLFFFLFLPSTVGQL